MLDKLLGEGHRNYVKLIIFVLSTSLLCAIHSTTDRDCACIARVRKGSVNIICICNLVEKGKILKWYMTANWANARECIHSPFTFDSLCINLCISTREKNQSLTFIPSHCIIISYLFYTYTKYSLCRLRVDRKLKNNNHLRRCPAKGRWNSLIVARKKFSGLKIHDSNISSTESKRYPTNRE